MKYLVVFFLFIFSSCSSTSYHAPWRLLIGAEKDSLSYDKRLTQMEYPFDVKMFRIDYLGENLEMAYMDISPKEETKEPVVLFHGKNFNGAYWEETAKSLVKAGHRVIIPDQIGFGKSSKPLHYQYSFHALAENTKDLLAHLDVDHFSIIGHSMGGMVATRYALMFPDHVHKLIMVNPIGLEDWKRKVPYTPFQKRLQSSLRANRDTIAKYQREAYYDGKWNSSYESHAKHLIGWTQGPDRVHMATIDALTVEMVFTQPVLYEFDLILAPTLLIIGDRDRTALGRANASPKLREQLGRYDRLGHRTCVEIPRCELYELEGIGHMPQVEAFNDYMSAISNFLD